MKDYSELAATERRQVEYEGDSDATWGSTEPGGGARLLSTGGQGQD